MRKKPALLILILIITILPTVFFLVGFVVIVSLVIQNSGNVQVFLYGDVLHISGEGGVRGAVMVGSFTLFIGCTIAGIVFFTALLLLIRDLLAQRRKKQKIRDSYTA